MISCVLLINVLMCKHVNKQVMGNKKKSHVCELVKGAFLKMNNLSKCALIIINTPC